MEPTKDNEYVFSLGRREDADRLERLRHEPEALPAIMLQLLVQKMGPSDYLKTKREVQAFIATGGLGEALNLLNRAALRRDEEKHREAQRETQTQNQRITP